MKNDVEQGNEKRHSILDSTKLTAFFNKHNFKLKHIHVIWRHVIQLKCTSFDEIPNLPKPLYSLLHENFSLTTLKVISSLTATDRSTTKLLIELPSGEKVETVIIRYGQCELQQFPKTEKKASTENSAFERQYRSAPRATVCVSSQVGCAMQCRFCATGTMGLVSNLSCGEILEQLKLAFEVEPIRNVVFMGMGEPLDNYKEVIAAIQLMIHPGVFALAQNRICVSTVGIVPRMRQLMKDAPLIGLALSLHAPTQELRERIVPSAKVWSIHALLEAAADFVKHQKSLNRTKFKNQRVLVEYVLIRNINATESVALQLAELLCIYKDIFHLNVIPYNPGVDEPEFAPPTQDEIDKFTKILRHYDIKVTVRQTMGQDISSACGQLVVKSQKDIEDTKLHEKPCYGSNLGVSKYPAPPFLEFQALKLSTDPLIDHIRQFKLCPS